MPPAQEDDPLLAVAVRSGFTESKHRGRAVGLGCGGTVALRAGAVGEPVFPRSASKPIQAAAMLRCGLGLGGRLLALAAASHSAEGFQLAGVREILAGAGLGESALACPAALPLDEAAAIAVLRSGGTPERVYNNCSGKHAAMAATCVAAGWPVAGYQSPDHPLQVVIRETVERLAGEPVAVTGVDGCGAPLHAISVEGIARALRAMVLADPGSPERMVADAIRAYPQWSSGTRRSERALMSAVPGLLVKSGAEGVEVFALADGRAGAVKIADGARRAVTPVTVALLRALGIAAGPAAPDGVDPAVLDALSASPLLGGGAPVGAVRAVWSIGQGPAP